MTASNEPRPETHDTETESSELAEVDWLELIPGPWRIEPDEIGPWPW